MSMKMAVLQALENNGPCSAKKLKKAVKADAAKLNRTLKAMQKSGLVQYVNGRYSLVQAGVATGGKGKAAAVAAVPAKIVKVGRGFGFAAPLDGSADIFVPGKGLQGALPGDEVEIVLYPRPRVAGSREGEVVAITKAAGHIVGTVGRIEGRLVLVPDSAPDVVLRIKKNGEAGTKPGEKAGAEFVARGERYDEHRLRVILRFGPAELAKNAAEAILYAAGIDRHFPEAAADQAARIAGTGVSAADIRGREDLRGQTIFTIDSAATKDMDDAVSVETLGDGYRLGVHIADVSHYIRAKTPLDEAALQRGTSVYFADNVVPMLPPELSNGICSLNPEEDRLTFSCIMDLDKNGKMTDYRFAKTVIRSRVKGVYSEINAIFDGAAGEAIVKKYADVANNLAVMRELYHKLAKLREGRGSMEIESGEAKILVDDKGRCVGVEKRSRGEAERLIEEFMLLANTAAAKAARTHEIPFVYRVHEKPAAEKIEQLTRILKAAGVEYHFKDAIPTTGELGKILEDTRGTALEHFVHTGVLRSMAKAKYEPAPKGHYGLALADYAHFTSPIRRYPDLAIHRILSKLVGGEPPAEIRKRAQAFAERASVVSSERELTAQRVERDCDDCYKAEYMQRFVGESFEGVISSVTQFGVYVQLENTVEGMVHISSLSADHMDLVEGIALSDPLTGKSYRIGDRVRALVEKADVARGNIDFSLL